MAEGPKKVTFTVPKADAGKRLDQILAANVPGLSRRRARVLLDIGGVFVDRARSKAAGKLLREGQIVEAVLGGAFERATSVVGNEARAKDESTLPSYAVVHEDEDLVVVEKPAGLLTAPTPESDRNNLADQLARRGGGKSATKAAIAVVHRIDLETSGLLVFAKTEHANAFLSERFRTHDLTREYLAVVAGAFPDSITTIDRPVNARRAVTHVKVEERLGREGTTATVIRATLETGRTHQIRIHASARGFAVLGDRKYGVPTAFDPPRMALHATRLGFVHPTTGETMDFTSPWPADLTPWLAALRTKEEAT